MEINFNTITNLIGSTALYSSIASLLVGGGVSIYKQWIFTEEQFRNKVDFTRQRIINKLAKHHTKMLNQILNSGISLDGSPPEIISDFSEECIRLNKLSNELDKIYTKVIKGFSLIIITIFISFFGVIITLLPTALAHTFIAIFFYILIILQANIIFRIRRARELLETYSQTI